MITPGPWCIGAQKEDGLLQITAGDAAHEITGIGSGPFDVVALVKTEANARLIAAAPEAIKAGCAALQKARGE